MQERKILLSPGYGAGWTSWHTNVVEEQLFMLTYQPWIEAIESGLDPSLLVSKRGPHTDLSEHPLAQQFKQDWELRFGDKDLPYFGGVYQLEVVTVYGPVRIRDYDGSESYDTIDDYSGYL